MADTVIAEWICSEGLEETLGRITHYVSLAYHDGITRLERMQQADAMAAGYGDLGRTLDDLGKVVAGDDPAGVGARIDLTIIYSGRMSNWRCWCGLGLTELGLLIGREVWGFGQGLLARSTVHGVCRAGPVCGKGHARWDVPLPSDRSAGRTRTTGGILAGDVVDNLMSTSAVMRGRSPKRFGEHVQGGGPLGLRACPPRPVEGLDTVYEAQPERTGNTPRQAGKGCKPRPQRFCGTPIMRDASNNAVAERCGKHGQRRTAFSVMSHI